MLFNTTTNHSECALCFEIMNTENVFETREPQLHTLNMCFFYCLGNAYKSQRYNMDFSWLKLFFLGTRISLDYKIIEYRIVRNWVRYYVRFPTILNRFIWFWTDFDNSFSKEEFWWLKKRILIGFIANRKNLKPFENNIGQFKRVLSSVHLNFIQTESFLSQSEWVLVNFNGFFSNNNRIFYNFKEF